MTEHERNKLACEKVLGWSQRDIEMFMQYGVRFFPMPAKLEAGVQYAMPLPTHNTLCDLLEAEIERQDLKSVYLDALMRILGYSYDYLGWTAGWALLRATPAQRRDAALQAVGVL